MGLADTFARTTAPDTHTRTAFLVIGTESVPDGRLLSAVERAGENLSPTAAIARADTGPVPVAFRLPVAVCVLRVGPDFSLINFKCLDAPHFRPREIVNQFWFGATHYGARLVTFNGRAADLPLLELAAFRYGISARDHYLARDRYRGPIDLTDWFTNFGACHLPGGLNLLAALLGKPGQSATPDVLRLYQEGKLPEINDACLCTALDTYFVFLRTRVLTGDLAPEQESLLADRAKGLLAAKTAEFPVLRRYLTDWTEPASA
ncbi:3'-5' exonuclease [Frigoriglobus tundricola]|uniref:Polysaccharide biosynthesis protein WlaX n=1 Tax=Frigoriglobus tundricola TaxID=2774151 RepID=A0A6M5YPZ7_9BACT|nr:3'-5' exonuclease [Frigoriglobus tundricola]QJW95426.1 Polysaccharide biosynthesis protein WlaX [Frigoriglobus tundricola]